MKSFIVSLCLFLPFAGMASGTTEKAPGGYRFLESSPEFKKKKREDSFDKIVEDYEKIRLQRQELNEKLASPNTSSSEKDKLKEELKKLDLEEKLVDARVKNLKS